MNLRFQTQLLVVVVFASVFGSNRRRVRTTLKLANTGKGSHFPTMGLSEAAITLQPEEVAELNRKLSMMRHNVNNQLALVIAALEVIRRKPEMAPRLLDNIGQQPDRIISEIRAFSDEFEKSMSITH